MLKCRLASSWVVMLRRPPKRTGNSLTFGNICDMWSQVIVIKLWTVIGAPSCAKWITLVSGQFIRKKMQCSRAQS